MRLNSVLVKSGGIDNGRPQRVTIYYNFGLAGQRPKMRRGHPRPQATRYNVLIFAKYRRVHISTRRSLKSRLGKTSDSDCLGSENRTGCE